MFNKKIDQSDILMDYAILIGSLGLGGLLIKAFRLDDLLLLVVTIPLSIGYVVWGILHHKKHGHIDRKILLEYLGLAILINSILFILVI